MGYSAAPHFPSPRFLPKAVPANRGQFMPDISRLICSPFVGRASFRFTLLTGLVLLGVAGCTQMAAVLNPPMLNSSTYEEEVKKREDYLANHSPDALRWLVVNRLKNGMSRADVNTVIGEDGERVFDDSDILASEGAHYRSDDMVYRWGPDSDGNVYLFVFRDDHLVNLESFHESIPEVPPRGAFHEP
uniref:Uncharacterized protein n=2 Tax=Rubinisphaera brasiliensis TaxID=119 RepID=F0SLK4_RUBBR|nr:hypothetical protein Plabr_0057 [Rubinisphaera brasiliensis DSM 5305]